jgi:hypothetical protein
MYNIVDNVDLILTLRKHGWSDFILTLDREIYRFFITNIWGDPYEMLMDEFSAIIEGAEEVSFLLHDEPGTTEFKICRIKNQKHTLQVTVRESDMASSPPRWADKCMFTVAQSQLVKILYIQLKKIDLLMQDDQYRQERTFPRWRFAKFEVLVNNFMEMK